ncbi:hypothetical protein JTE90_001779 [Oedothorax gibbosus]|uniref:Potassium channel domain-containing protein n=1 Tax=Oedothorax gibbosus TaxID=931172 RepID=A0AAV6VQS6_9ARAC|nr:hypothetical protein JTE90_001779 [Oedothorax gibbosus]
MHNIVLIGFTRRVISMLAVYVLYLSLGAIIFVYLERKSEEEKRHAALTSSKLVRRMVEVLRKNNFSDGDIVRTFNAKHAVWEYNTNHVPVTWNLVYPEKVLFCLILITTIGYGNVAPETSLGKCLCIVYTFFGIPLNVTFMRLLSLKFRAYLQSILSLCQRVWSIPVALGGVLYFVLLSGLLVFSPATVFQEVEHWSYVQAVYYCFVSLSTIGLGDYVAGLASRRIGSSYYIIYVSLLFLWLLIGVAFVWMCLNLMSYLIGSLFVDKLDCKCRKRSAARKEMTEVYQCLAELNWSLAKGKPKAFRDWKIFEDFMTMNVENPENISQDYLYQVFEAANELRAVIYKEVTADGEQTLMISEMSANAQVPDCDKNSCTNLETGTSGKSTNSEDLARNPHQSSSLTTL